MGQKEQAIITVHVHPNAKQDKVLGFQGDILKVKVTALPINGKANKKLVKFLSNLLGISKSNLVIEKGTTSKIKTIAIRGMGQDEVRRELGKCQNH
ncbi:DUF167 domain-containing protein [Chloroflexota bacterium]